MFTAETSIISPACDFYKDDVNEEQLQSKIRQFLESTDLNNPTPNAILKQLTENPTLTNSFPSVTCLQCMYFALPCTTCEAERFFRALRRVNISD